MFNEFEQKIIAQCKALQPQLIEAIRRLVSIYSVEGEPEEDAPFGEMPKKALVEALKLSEELGFETTLIDHKIGYAQFGKENHSDYYGVFGHVDVVPIGKGWQYDPLGGEIANNRMYGRGVLDNKGPILSNLFALYCLKELGVYFKTPIRIVFGSNEETGFKCVKHYITKCPPPIFGWTPDCKWPVVYGEKGRMLLRFLCHADDVSVLYQFANDYILSSLNDGKKLGIHCQDDDFGALITSGYQFGLDDGKHFIEIKIAYPTTYTKDEMIERIQKILPAELSIQMVRNWDPVLYDKESKQVRILQQVYNDVTNLDVSPVTTNGGTYAKIIPNIIAYGPSYPGQRDIAHLPDEWIDLDDLERNTIIYALALWRLSQQD